MLPGFRRVMSGVRVVAVRDERVVPRLFVIPRLMMLCCFAVVPGRQLVVFGRTSMVLGPVVGCHNRLLEWDAYLVLESLCVRTPGGQRERVTPR
jgi:hypothetical protein